MSGAEKLMGIAVGIVLVGSAAFVFLAAGRAFATRHADSPYGQAFLRATGGE